MIWLAGATLQVSAILLVALGMVWLLRKRSASLRHWVLVIAMACATIAPLLGAYLPAWPGTQLPAFIETPAAPGYQTIAEHARPVVMTDTALQQVQSIAPDSGMSASAAVQARTWRDASQSAVRAVAVIYSAGVAVCLLRLIAGLLRLRWIATQAEPLRSSQWQRRAAAISFAFRLRRSVRLMRSSRPVLATWGIVRPQVLLPADAEDWPEDRFRAVLLHELAHIHRNDWLIQVLAGVMRSIYWFNPLVWLAFARLRQESEQACDDAALRQGEDNVQYAAQLLALARSLNEQVAPELSAAPAMALRSTLKRRIAMVLDPATSRAPPSRTTLTTISVSLLLATCAIAACNGKRTTAANDAAPGAALNTPATEPVTPASLGTMNLQAAEEAPTPAVDSPPQTAPVVEPAADRSARSGSAAPDRSQYAEQRSPAVIAASILELVDSALADESLAVLDEIQRPITGLHHVQRSARAVLAADEQDPGIQAANYVEIINALKNTALFASNVTSTPRGAMLSKPRIDQLAAAMRAKSAELAEAMMPTPGVTSMFVSTPERRAAVSALDLAQTTLRSLKLSERNSNSWLVNELDTLERAAQSVLSDDGTSNSGFTTKLYALRAALVSTSRNANNILQRPRLSPDMSSNAKDLTTSIRRIVNQLDGVRRDTL